MKRGNAVSRVEACLARIEEKEPELCAFITVAADTALAEAEAADRAEASGESLGILHGIPVAIKDCIDVAGMRCTSGSRYFYDRVANADAFVVSRLRAQGAIVLGKTNLHEFCYGGTTQNETFGSCRNPWNTERIPGGSSGGSAAAVASGMCDVALGTDTGVSIRMPSALCGVTGLRPTAGAISNSGILSVSPPHDTVGPIARSIVDVARIYRATAAHDPSDPQSSPWAARPDVFRTMTSGVGGLRILVPRQFFFDDVDDAVSDAVMAAARQFERMGATILESDIEGAERTQEHLNPIVYTDAAEAHSEKLASDPDLIGKQVRLRLEPGFATSGVDYARCLRWLERWRNDVSRIFAETCDLVLTPTVPTTAPEIGAQDDIIAVTSGLSRLGWAWPAAGVPAISLPCGFAPDGLPVGVQIAAAAWREDLLIQAGHAFQSATDWHLSRPQ